MLKPVRGASLVSLVAVAVLLSGAGPAGQTVIVKPTAPPAVQKPADKPQAEKPAAKPQAEKPAEKTGAEKPAAQQKPAPPERPAPPPPPPDRQALMTIQKLPDNAEKIAAIEKWLKDFPDSSGKASAYSLMFDTLIKHRPTDRAAILDWAQKYIDTGTEPFRATPYSRIASSLLNAGLFLDDAARIAERGLAVFEEDETKRMAQSRATHLATLGRIRFKQGRIGAAEKALKAAYAANPEIPTALIGLAELADHRKNSKAALNYWMQAALTGRLSKEDREKFETAYRTANGTLDTLDAALDAKYKATFTPPVHPEPYKPTAMRADRVVLAEVFTGAGCPPCVAADLAFDAALERYSRTELAVVMYHLHIPQPDPLTNKATIERAKYYSVNGVPTAAIEGVSTVGGGNRAATKGVYDRIRPTIDKALETAAGARLALDAAIASGGVVNVKATPSSIAPEGEAVKLQIMLVEEMLSYSGENGVRFHPMVVRSIAGENYGGFSVDRKAPTAMEHEFDIAKIAAEHKAHLDDYEVNGRHGKITFSRKPTAIDQGNLSVVAFLQEEKTKKVLQAAYVRLRPVTTSTASR